MAMKSKKIILVVMISLLAAHFLIYGCGTRTKTKTETQTEISAKEIAKEQDSIATSEEVILSKVEEKMKELEQKFRESQKNDETETTLVKKQEIEFDGPAWVEVGNQGKKININNGRIVTSETITKARKQSEKTTEIDSKRIESEKKKTDSTAIANAIKTGIKEGIKELTSVKKSSEKNVVQKGGQPGFWFWFWIVLILLILIAIWIFRKWLRTKFPFLRFLK